MPPVHFGVSVPQIKRTWEQTRRAAAAFEALGFDSLWVNDHLYGPQSPAIPMLEAWSLVAALAAVTERVEIGTLVTPMGMRNPAHLGKIVATIDNVAGGRIIPGFGAGWMEREFADFDVPFLPLADRLRQLRGGVALLKQMWDPAIGPVSFEGDYFQTRNVVTEPKPPRRVPIMIGGAGEKVTLRIAAEHGDIWNNLAGHQHDLAHKIDVLRGHCATLGRDPGEIVVSQQALCIVARDDADAVEAIGKAQKIFGGHMGDPAGPLALAGTPETIRRRVQQHVDLGCTMFMLEFFGTDTVEPATRFAETVLPHFR